jgi:hypothetical protein
VAALLATLGASGCSRWDGQFPFVSLDTRLLGTKMLRPHVGATVCRFEVFGRTKEPSVVDEVLQRLRAADEEADGLLNLRVAVTGWNLGVVSRICATGVADVVRATPVTVIPMPGAPDHGAHH